MNTNETSPRSALVATSSGLCAEGVPLLERSWNALVDPAGLQPAPGSTPRQLLEKVDGAWGDDARAWALVRSLVDYGRKKKVSAEEEAGLNGERPSTAVGWAYWAVLDLHEQLRRTLSERLDQSAPAQKYLA